MDLADESGIESLAMRELGRRLGVEAASLYNHVAGKGDLLDTMAEVVVAEIDLPSRGADWGEAMRRRAVSASQVFSHRRWAAALIDSRELSGPRKLSYADLVLGTLLRAGFSPRIAANAGAEHRRRCSAGIPVTQIRADRGLRSLLGPRCLRGERHASAYSCLMMSTEISTAGIAPRFSSQCVVFLSSGQPTPGP